MTAPDRPLVVTLLPPALDSDEVTVTAHVGDVELTRVTVYPYAVPAGYVDRVADLVAGLLRDAMHARTGTP